MNSLESPLTQRAWLLTARPGLARTLLILALLFSVVWFGTLDYRKLIKTDEGRYAEISREMAMSGDWVTPRLNDLKYFEKPPLQYWAGAALMSAFGYDAWQPRLWTALTGFLSIVLLGFTALRLFGARIALCATVVLASSTMWIYLGHINSLDMGLAAFMNLAFCGVLLSEHARHEQRSRAARNWMLAAWVGMALAVLSKGLIGIVLPGGAVLVYVLMWRDWALFTRLRWLPGLALFFAITAPWFVLVSLRNPEFAQFFFVHEHFDRFLTKAHRRPGSFWYFFPVLAVGLLPWSGFLPHALWRGARAQSIHQPAQVLALRFAVVWTVLIFVFFSISSSKLPGYILPIFPAMALLIGVEINRWNPRHLMFHGVALGLACVAAAFLLRYALTTDGDDPMSAIYRNWLMLALAVAALAALASALSARRGRQGTALLTLAVGTYVTINLSLLGHESLSRSMSAYAVAREIRPLLTPTTPIYSVGMYEHSLGYYLQRAVTLVAFRDELDLGLTQEPQKGIATIEQFIERWQSGSSAIAILGPDIYRDLLTRKLPMRIVYRDPRRIVISRLGEPIIASRAP